jgi:nucleoside diphosphate kinase
MSWYVGIIFISEIEKIFSGPISCHILGRENAIQEWRSMLGPTKVFK